MSTTHNKNLNPLLNLLINCISAKSAPQILSLNLEQTFLFLNVLIIGLCNSLANCLLCLILFLKPLPDRDLSGSKADFLSKTCKS